MENNKTLDILKAFYLGCEDMAKISRRTKASRDEVREVLRGARECGLIRYTTHGYNEIFNHPESKKLGAYLRNKGVLK